jgi:hypothetical protein
MRAVSGRERVWLKFSSRELQANLDIQPSIRFISCHNFAAMQPHSPLGDG